MIEFIVGLAVVLVAGYLIAEHRDRVRSIASAVALGVSAGKALSDVPDHTEHDHRHDGESHPSGPHWEGNDSTHHTDSI